MSAPRVTLVPVDGRPLDVVGLLQAGAVLLNGRGERFMRRFDPDRLERAPIALLVTAADAEIRAGRCTSRGAVIVDATHLAADGTEQPVRIEVVPWTRAQKRPMLETDERNRCSTD